MDLSLLLRLALTAAFLYFGLRKLIGDARDVAVYEAIGFGQWPRPITGSVETLCAIGLWLPAVSGLAALGLLGTVIVGCTALALFTQLPRSHMYVLIAASALMAWLDRASLWALLPGA